MIYFEASATIIKPVAKKYSNVLRTAYDNLMRTLTNRRFSLAILIIAIAGRLLEVLYFFNIRSDRSFQLLATTNLLKGHGVSLAQVYSSDLSKTVYTVLINWPPAYSIIIAPIYALSGHNYLVAAIVVDMIAAVVLILVSRAILKILEVPVLAINLYTIVAGFFIYPFYFISSTDSLALTVFIIAVYYTLLLLKRWNLTLWQMLILSFFLLLCAALKYLFIPMVFVIPFYLLIKGIIKSAPIFKKTAVLSLLFISGGLALLFLYQLNSSGSAAYVSSGNHGFFPHNILEAYPFMVASFLNPASLVSVFSNHYFTNFIYSLFQVINTVLVILVVGRIAVKFFNSRSDWSLPGDFFLLAAFISLTLLLLLCFLSIRIAKTEELPGSWWTFIQEPRYYAVPIVLIQLSTFVLFKYSVFKTRAAWKYIFYTLCFFLLIESLHGMLFTANRLIKLGKEEYSWQGDLRFQRYADQVIGNLKKEYKLPMVVYSSSYYMANRVGLYSKLPILYKMDSFTDFHTSKPILLLEILNNEDLAKSRPLLKSNPLGYSNGLYFYATYVQPH